MSELDRVSDPEGVSKGWDLASMALTAGVAAGGIWGGYKLFGNVKNTPINTSTLRGGPTHNPTPGVPGSVAMNASQVVDHLMSLGNKVNEIGPLPFGIPKNSRKNLFDRQPKSMVLSRAMWARDLADKGLDVNTDEFDALMRIHAFNPTSATVGGTTVGSLQIPGMSDSFNLVNYASKSGAHHNVLEWRKPKLGGGLASVHARPFRSYVFPTFGGAPVVGASHSVLANATARAKTRVANIHGQTKIAPGVLLSGKALGLGYGQGKEAVWTLEHFLNEARTSLLAKTSDKTLFQIPFGFKNQEEAVSGVLRGLSEFATAVLKGSSDSTGGFSYNQLTAVVDMADYRMNDKNLFGMLTQSGFFEKHLGISPKDARAVLSSYKAGQTGHGESMGPMERAHEVYSYTENIAKLENQGIYTQGQNNTAFAKGTLTTLNPHAIIPAGYFQSAHRRLDEITHRGVSASLQGLSRKQTRKLESGRLKTYIAEGARNVSDVMLHDLEASVQHVGVNGFMGFTTYSRLLNPLDISDPRKLYEQAPESYRQKFSFETFKERILPRSVEFERETRGGLVHLFGGMRGSERGVTSRAFGINKLDAQIVLNTGTHFALPSVKGQYPRFIQKTIEAISGAGVAGDANTIYENLLAGKHNDILPKLNIYINKGDVVAFSKLGEGKFDAHKSQVEGILRGFEPHPETGAATSKPGFSLNVLTHENIQTGDQLAVGSGGSGHATAYTGTEYSVGRMEVGGRAMNPGAILNQATLREAGAFHARYTDPLLHSFDYFKYVLHKNKLIGLKGESAKRLNAAITAAIAGNKLVSHKAQVEELAKIINTRMGGGTVDVISLGRQKTHGAHSSTFGLKWNVVTQDALGNVGADALRGMESDIDSYSRKLLEGYKTFINDYTPDNTGHIAFKDLAIADLETALNPNAELSFNEESGLVTSSRSAMVTIAAKSNSNLEHVSNIGKAGTFGHPHSAKTTLSAVSALAMHATNDASGVYQRALNHLLTGSKITTLGYETIGLLHAISGSSKSMLDSFREAGLDHTKVLGPQESHALLQEMVASGEWNKIVRWSGKRMQNVNEAGPVPEGLKRLSNLGLILDLSGRNISTKGISGGVVDNTIGQYFVGPTAFQAPGSNEHGDFILGNYNRENIDVIDQYLSGGGRTLELAIDKKAETLAGLIGSKKGIANALVSGNRGGLSGSMRVTGVGSLLDSMRAASGETGLGPNQLPLYEKSAAGFAPIDQRMTAFMSGKAIGKNAEQAIAKEVGVKSKDVLDELNYFFVRDSKGRYVPMGVAMESVHQGYPALTAESSALPQRMMVLTRTKAFDEMRKADPTLNFEQLVKESGLKHLHSNPEVMFSDLGALTIQFRDVDGDIVSVVSMGTGKDIQRSLREMRESIVDSGFYDAIKSKIYKSAEEELRGGADKWSPTEIFNQHLTGKNLNVQVNEIQSRSAQKAFTGSMDVFAHSYFDPTMDMVRNLSISDATEDTIGHLLSLGNLNEAEAGLIGRFKGEPGFLKSIAGTLSSIVHSLKQTPITKGGANVNVGMALLEVNSSNKGLRHASQKLWDIFAPTAAGWQFQDTAWKEGRVKQILEQTRAVVLESLSTWDAEAKAALLVKMQPDLEGPAAEKKVFGMFGKTTNLTSKDATLLFQGLSAEERDTFASASYKILTGHQQVLTAQAKDLDMRGGSSGILSRLKSNGASMNLVHLTTALGQLNGDNNAALLYALSRQGSAPSDIRNAVTESISNSNMNEARHGRGGGEDTTKAGLRSLERINEHLAKTDNLTSDVMGVFKNLKQYATDTIAGFNVPAGDPEWAPSGAKGRVLSESREAALTNVKSILENSWNKGRGKTAAAVGGVGLGLLGIAHIAGWASGGAIDVNQQASLPRKIPLDDAKYSPEPIYRAPKANVRVTSGGVTPARATIDTTYDSDVDPRAFIDQMNSQTSIGQGTMVVNDTASMNRQGYRRKREQQLNSRF